MTSGFQFPFDRVTWRDGQMLAASDLTLQKKRADRLRWLHNLYVHGAADGNWGIVEGLTPALTTSGKHVTLTEGLAVDSLGRDLVVPRNVAIPVPPITGTRLLAIRYQEDKAYRARRMLKAVCEGTPLDPRLELPLFAWLEPTDVEPGLDILIAAANINSGVAISPLDSFIRSFARPVQTAKLVSGVSMHYESPWVDGPAEPVSFWLETTVDTSAAGFNSTPLYFPALQRSGGTLQVFQSPGLYIVDAQPRQFKLRMITGLKTFGLPNNASQAIQMQLDVAWVGFQPSLPPASATTIFHLAGYQFDFAKFVAKDLP